MLPFAQMARKLYPDLDLDSLPVPTKCNKQTVSTEAMIDNEIDEMLNGPYLASRADSVPEEPTTVPTNDIEAELRAELAELKGPNLARGSKFRVCGLNILKEGAAPAYRHIETGTECCKFTWMPKSYVLHAAETAICLRNSCLHRCTSMHRSI